jgi:hypothetical protein
MQVGSSCARVLPIKKANIEEEVATENREIGKELLQAFFSIPLPCEQENTSATYDQLT